MTAPRPRESVDSAEHADALIFMPASIGCTNPRVRHGAVLWLTGLSGSGKSTLAFGAGSIVNDLGIDCAMIDGDVLRHGLCRDLGYSDEDRCENIRRAGEAAISRAKIGLLAIVALISPFERARQRVAARCTEEGVPFALVHVAASLASCEARDPKGLYRRARAGELDHFTGISSPYEEPLGATLTLRTDAETVAHCLQQVVNLGLTLVHRGPSFWIVV